MFKTIASACVFVLRSFESILVLRKSTTHTHDLYAMPTRDVKKIPEKLTDAQKKQNKQNNKLKADPEKAERKKKKNDACRERRAEAGSSKAFS